MSVGLATSGIRAIPWHRTKEFPCVLRGIAQPKKYNTDIEG